MSKEPASAITSDILELASRCTYVGGVTYTKSVLKGGGGDKAHSTVAVFGLWCCTP
jgi:hypothetical protein